MSTSSKTSTRASTAEDILVVGVLGRTYGVKGWLKVNSYTSPQENILDFADWLWEQNGNWVKIPMDPPKAHNQGVIAHVHGYDQPEIAKQLTGKKIAILRSELPVLEADEYYWTDLQGCLVVTTSGVELGRVDYIFETGSNDVLVVKGERERLIPLLTGSVVQNIDLEDQLIHVDWDPEF